MYTEAVYVTNSDINQNNSMNNFLLIEKQYVHLLHIHQQYLLQMIMQMALQQFEAKLKSLLMIGGHLCQTIYALIN